MIRALLICSISAFPVFVSAQIVPAAPAAPASVPAPAAPAALAECPPVPFSIEAKEIEGRVNVKMPPAFEKADSLPKLANVNAGAEYVRTMYGAMGPTVIRTVLENYVCRFNKVIDEDQTLTQANKEAYKAAFQDAVDEIVAAGSNYFPAYASQKFDVAMNLRPTVAAFPALAPTAQIPQPYLQRAYGGIKDDSFLIANTYTGYLGGTFGGIEVSACGRYIRAALAENAYIVQQLAASMRSTLNTYFSNKPASVKSAMTIIYAEAASAASVTVPSKRENQPLAGFCAAS